MCGESHSTLPTKRRSCRPCVSVCAASSACCSPEEIGDCEPTTAEIRGDRWFAWLREQARWVEIPHEVILRDVNPSPEKAHLCFAYERVLCFLPPHSGG
jgi:hypothetical protein